MWLKIEKIKKGGELLLSDGTRLAGEFFLCTHSPVHSGSELVGDLLLSDTFFIPFQLPRGETVFVQKECIVMVVLKEKELNKALPYLKRVGVQISLLSGHDLQGAVYLDLPQERRRVSDFFNTYRGFFYFESDDGQYLLNSRFIKTARPTQEV